MRPNGAWMMITPNLGHSAKKFAVNKVTRGTAFNMEDAATMPALGGRTMKLKFKVGRFSREVLL